MQRDLTRGFRCQANWAQIRQSRPDHGLGFWVKDLRAFHVVPSWLGSGLKRLHSQPPPAGVDLKNPRFEATGAPRSKETAFSCGAGAVDSVFGALVCVRPVELSGRGTTRADESQWTASQSHMSPSSPVYEGYDSISIWQVDTRLPRKRNSNSHGARPVH